MPKLKAHEYPLLKLLQQRWDMFIKDMPDRYRSPQQDAVLVEKAVMEYTAYHNSDPFAEKRIRLHLSRGLELASDVAKAYHKRNVAREVAKRFAQNAQAATAATVSL